MDFCGGELLGDFWVGGGVLRGFVDVLGVLFEAHLAGTAFDRGQRH